MSKQNSSSKQQIISRSNHINSLMQNGKSNKEARAIADSKSNKTRSRIDNDDPIDRSYGSPMQDWATSADDF
jgi:hypothetical protein